MNFIDRKEYFNFLLRQKDKQVIKVISGIKGCGRTTLLDIYKDYLIKTGISKEQLISINLEDITYQDKNYKELYFYIKNKLIEGKMTYIFLDEIQNCKNFEKMVDSLFIQPNVDIYITGSNAYFMSGELATLLSGRYVELKMLPLSFKEYVSGVNNSKSIVAKYNDYIKVIDFYTGKELALDDISIDHVIPWSFMYSDDIWNLVITSKTQNSQKNNSIPSKKIIEKLKERNNKIKDIVSDSFKMDIEDAMKNNYLDKFYYECRL